MFVGLTSDPADTAAIPETERPTHPKNETRVIARPSGRGNLQHRSNTTKIRLTLNIYDGHWTTDSATYHQEIPTGFALGMTYLGDSACSHWISCNPYCLRPSSTASRSPFPKGEGFPGGSAAGAGDRRSPLRREREQFLRRRGWKNFAKPVASRDGLLYN